MKPYDPENAPPEESPIAVTSSHPEARATGVDAGCYPREIALDFPVGDGRTGRCHIRLFRPADEAKEQNASDGGLVVAFVEAPPGGGGFDLAQYAASIANALCERENLSPDRLLYIDHDQDRGSRLAQWAVLLGPHVMQSYGSLVSEGAFDNEAFCLVAFDFQSGALTNPRFTPLSRLDIEGILGEPFA